MKEPQWLLREVIFAAHEQSLAQFGGLEGVRDVSMLESALGKPLNVFAYGKPNLFELAASYAYGIIKNHPFIDGNKRSGFIAAIAFLEINGYRFQANQVDATLQTLALAAGELSEAAFAKWLKVNSKSTSR